MQRGLFAGFGQALPSELERLKLSPNPACRAGAAWGLALWYRSLGDIAGARSPHYAGPGTEPSSNSIRSISSFKIEALLELGREIEADAVIKNGIARLGKIPQLCLSAANAAALKSGLSQSERNRLRLDWLNKPLVEAVFARLEMKDKSRPLAFDNFKTAKASRHPRSNEAKISLLMPAYNAETTIAVVIESLLKQTWTNIELLIVDDASSDGTWSIINSIAARDPRIVALRHEQNRGAYAARNTALEHASGDYVTINDADDWSHPERLALQMVDLLDGGRALNTTKIMRVAPDLRVHVKSDGDMLVECFTSLLTRREPLVALGGWDETRVGADDELYQRLLLKVCAKKKRLLPNVPLSIGVLSANSMTMQKALGLDTIRYGARREYVDAYRHWHKLEMKKREPDLTMRRGERRFPAPHICLFGAGKSLRYDILLVSDFSITDDTGAENIGMLRVAQRMGLRVACFHWPHLDHADMETNPDIRQLLHDGVADTVVAGERVHCSLAIVTHLPILDQRPDRLLDVRADACVMIVDQAPLAGDTGQVASAIDTARSVFGAAPILAPASPLLRSWLLRAHPSTPLTPIDWTPIFHAAESNADARGSDFTDADFSQAQFGERVRGYLA